MHKISVQPTEEPVPLEDAKLHLRVDSDEEDTHIQSLIVAARSYVESRSDRQLCTATWTLKLDGFGGAYCPIDLPKPPLIAVSSITYVDTAGTTQTLSSSLYTVDAQSEPGNVRPAYTQIWPSQRGHVNDVTITYTAGYGAAASVPSIFKHAILLLVGHWYEAREAAVVDQGFAAAIVPFGVDALIDQGLWTIR